MMTPAEAANKVKQTQGYAEVLFVKDYDSEHYVVEALKDSNDLSSDLFGVDKNTGAVTGFFPRPGGTLEKYSSAKCLKFE
jgi:hypothetical protein